MLGRHNRPWMTSGACVIARTPALRRILAAHSFWFPGEEGGAAYYLWLWLRRGKLQPPGRYRIGFRRVRLDRTLDLPHERALAYAYLAAHRWWPEQPALTPRRSP